jgi:ABC-2 type transport system permease protein
VRELAVIARWHFRELRRSALLWAVALGALSALEVAIYPSVHESLSKAIESYPHALREAFNVGDFSTVQSFLDAEMFSLIIPLAAGFFAVRSTTRALAAAEERHWLDVLLAAPLTRTQLTLGALGGTAAALALMLVATALPTELAGVVVGETVPVGLLAAGLAGVWVLALFCAALAALGSGLNGSAAAVTAGAMSVLVTMYTLNLAGKLAPSVDAIRWASAFRYTEAAVQDGLDVAGVAGVLAVGSLVAAAGVALFERKDVAA